LIAMDYFTKWLEVYTIPNHEASTVAESLVANIFCHFGIPREMYSDQGRNFELQEVLQCPGVIKTCIMPLHPQSDDIVERYIKMIEAPAKVVASHQRDWDERLHLFLLAYRASTNETTGLTPAILVFGRELQINCDLLFGVPPDRNHNRLCGRLNGPSTRHPQLCLPTPEAGQRPAEHSVR
jgi:hypothetical protein